MRLGAGGDDQVAPWSNRSKPGRKGQSPQETNAMNSPTASPAFALISHDLTVRKVHHNLPPSALDKHATGRASPRHEAFLARCGMPLRTA